MLLSGLRLSFVSFGLTLGERLAAVRFICAPFATLCLALSCLALLFVFACLLLCGSN
jgi:hypothetical protein